MAVPSALVLLLLPAQARAEPHRLCIYLDIGDQFWDASPRAADGEEFHEEFGRNEGAASYPAQRWLARVRNATTDAVLFGWSPLDGSGCADFELPADETQLMVEWVQWAAWGTGNQLVGYQCEASLLDCRLVPIMRSVNANVATGITEIVDGQSVEPESIDWLFWAATFAEERFASIGEQPLENTRIYVGYDPADVLPGATQADRTFGNQPSLVMKGESWHSKFTIAHELGHLQTIIAQYPSFGPAELDYCHDPAAYPAVPVGCNPEHFMDRPEWQAAALIEGIAHWYAVSVWNDVDLVGDCPLCPVRYVEPVKEDDARTYLVPRPNQPQCNYTTESPCSDGVGIEWDWLSAFRLFRLGASEPPSFHTMFTMAAAAYEAGNWIPNGPDGDFWDAFDEAMEAHLGADHASWHAAALQMELNR